MTECSEIALSLVDELSSTPSQRFVFVPCWMLDMFRVLEMYLSLTYESISPCSPMKIFIRNAKGNTVPGTVCTYVHPNWWYGKDVTPGIFFFYGLFLHVLYWLYRVPKDPLQDQNSITNHQAFQPNQPNTQIDRRNNMPFPMIKTKKRSIDCHGPRSCSRTMVIDSTTHMFDTSIA
jgi:hypothetical protein